ncbi:MAG: hypothetical protein ACREVL_02025 [Solimonas sp.]
MKASRYLLFILGFSLMLSLYEAILGARAASIGDGLQGAWAVAFAVLVALWARADAPTRPVSRPFDFGFLFLLFWPVALPWYLVRTRGMEGLVLFAGFFALYFAPFVSGLLTYFYLAPAE